MRNTRTSSGVAIDGFDPVCYFHYGTAAEGKKEFAFKADGITDYFTSTFTRAAFAEDQKNTNLNMEDGVHSQWAIQAKKLKSILEHLKLSMVNYTFFLMHISIIPFPVETRTKKICSSTLIKLDQLQMIMKNNVLYFIIRLIPAIILFQTLLCKFSGSEESKFIFESINAEPIGRIT